MHGVYACEIVYYIFLRNSMLEKRMESQAKGMCTHNLCFMCSHNEPYPQWHQKLKMAAIVGGLLQENC